MSNRAKPMPDTCIHKTPEINVRHQCPVCRKRIIEIKAGEAKIHERRAELIRNGNLDLQLMEAEAIIIRIKIKQQRTRIAKWEQERLYALLSDT